MFVDWLLILGAGLLYHVANPGVPNVKFVLQIV